MKKAIIGIIALAFMIVLAGNAVGITSDTDVAISPGDEEGNPLYTDAGDIVTFTISSDEPVDVYIVESEDFSYMSSDLSDPVLTRMGVTTELSFSYTIPDSQVYYLVIHNNGTNTATVDYEFNDPSLDFIMDDVEDAFEFATMICLIGVIAVVAIIGLVIFLIVRSSNNKKAAQPQYPPQQYPAAQPQYPAPVQAPVQQQTTPCTTCQGQARWIAEHNKWYCDNCGKYL